MGWVGGAVAGVLGLLALLCGFLAAKKSQKGKGAIIVGAVAVILAVVMAIAGINMAKSYLDQIRNDPEKAKLAPTLMKYSDNINTSMGLLGIPLSVQNETDQNAILEELQAVANYEQNKAKETVTEKTEEIKDQVQETVDNVTEQVQETVDNVTDKVEDIKDDVQETVEQVTNPGGDGGIG